MNPGPACRLSRSLASRGAGDPGAGPRSLQALLLQGLARVIARFVVQSPSDGSRGRSMIGSTVSSAPSSRAAVTSQRVCGRPSSFSFLRGGGGFRLCRCRLRLRLCRCRRCLRRLGGIGLAVRRGGCCRLRFLAVLAVIGDVETRALEYKPGCRNASLRRDATLRHFSSGGAEPIER